LYQRESFCYLSYFHSTNYHLYYCFLQIKYHSINLFWAAFKKFNCKVSGVRKSSNILLSDLLHLKLFAVKLDKTDQGDGKAAKKNKELKVLDPKAGQNLCKPISFSCGCVSWKYLPLTNID